jgi:hypothetical protein
MHGATTLYRCPSAGGVYADLAPTAGPEEVRTCVARVDGDWELYALVMFSGTHIVWVGEQEFQVGVSGRAEEVVDTGADLRELVVREGSEEGTALAVYTWRGTGLVRVFHQWVSGDGPSRTERFRTVRSVATIDLVPRERRARGRSFVWDARTFAFVPATSGHHVQQVDASRSVGTGGVTAPPSPPATP